MPRIALTDRAYHDLREVRQFSTAEWGEAAALKYLRDINVALLLLEDNPGLLRHQSNLSDYLKFYRVNKHLLIFYTRKDTTILMALRHVAIDLIALLPDLEPSLIAEAEFLHKRLHGL